MAGVQIFTESPISTAVKNDNPTTTTTADAPQPAAVPAPVASNPPASQSTGPFAPQPAAFLPLEPSTNQSTPTSTSTSNPQSTTAYIPPRRSGSLTPSYPPSPQPQATLDAPSFPRSRSVSPRRDIPPPPKAGEKMKPASYYSPAATPTGGYQSQQTASYNPQQQFPQPTGHTPSTATFAQQQQQGLLSPHPNGVFSPMGFSSGSGSGMSSNATTPTMATLPTGGVSGASGTSTAKNSFEHPPGYVQNPYAADMTPEQRFATQRGAMSPTLGYNSTPTAAGGFTSPNPFASFAGNGAPMGSPGVNGSNGSYGGNGRGGILDNGNDDGSVWGVVSGWAKTAGKKMSEVEGEVWKRINGDR